MSKKMVENNRKNGSNFPDIDADLLIGNVSEIIPNQLYFACFNEDVEEQVVKGKISYISFHGKFHYEPFYQDFGPWNLSVLYRLCYHIDNNVQIEERRGRRIVMYCCDRKNGEFEKIRVNCAYVLASYLIIYHGASAEEAFLTVNASQPPKYIGFRDASMGEPTYLLHLQDVLRGVEKALRLTWLDFTDFDYQEYEYYEKVENGDFNWIIPNKILSFCGPHNESRIEDGYPYHSPEVYFDYFREKNVSTIVRLNAKNYDASKFVQAGFEHVDLFFVDGSTPSNEIVEKFIKVVDNAKGAVAVHCKAGLGRTGTLIACWMMKEYLLSACECMAWLRICRPGSVIGPQQRFLIEKQQMCWNMSNANVASIKTGVKGAEKKTIKKLTNQVDEISLNINDSKPSIKENRRLIRPNILPLRRRPITISQKEEDDEKKNQSEVVDETELDDKGRSQGDRLLALKAKHQHEKGSEKRKEVEKNGNQKYVKDNDGTCNIPSQSYLNRNRQIIMPNRETTSNNNRQLRSPNGNVAYRTKTTGNGTLNRTPASAVFPSMATRRSDVTRFTSPTTPIKPMSPSITTTTISSRCPIENNLTTAKTTPSTMASSTASLRYKARLRGEVVVPPISLVQPPQISRCTLSSSEQKTDRILSSTSKSMSALRKVQLSRPRPYPPQGVRIELSANGSSYELRPRVHRDYGKIPGENLAANTDVLLGNKRKKTCA